MGNMFAQPKPLKEIVRENQRMIKKAIRELEKELRDLDKKQKTLGTEIRKMIKQNQHNAAKVMIKDLVRTKKYYTKFIEMKTHLVAVELKLQTMKTSQAMADAMKGVTTALVKMNKVTNLPALQKIMAEFMKENERNEIMQETIGDTIDDAMEEEGSAEEEDLVYRQVLDEVGVKASDLIPDAPNSQPATKVAETRDPAQEELEKRLNNLNR